MSSRRYGRATASAFLRIFSFFSLFMLVATPLITTAQEIATPPVEDVPSTAMINVSVTSDAGDTTGTSVCLDAECQTWAGTILTFIVPVTSDITWTATPVSGAGVEPTQGSFISPPSGKMDLPIVLSTAPVPPVTPTETTVVTEEPTEIVVPSETIAPTETLVPTEAVSPTEAVIPTTDVQSDTSARPSSSDREVVAASDGVVTFTVTTPDGAPSIPAGTTLCLAPGADPTSSTSCLKVVAGDNTTTLPAGDYTWTMTFPEGSAYTTQSGTVSIDAANPASVQVPLTPRAEGTIMVVPVPADVDITAMPDTIQFCVVFTPSGQAQQAEQCQPLSQAIATGPMSFAPGTVDWRIDFSADANIFAPASGSITVDYGTSDTVYAHVQPELAPLTFGFEVPADAPHFSRCAVLHELRHPGNTRTLVVLCTISRDVSRRPNQRRFLSRRAGHVESRLPCGRSLCR